MDKEIAVLLMSHGDFAKSAIESAELIIGKQENYETLSVFLVDHVNSLKEEMLEKVERLDTSKGLIVFTDIVGGTPMNLAGNLIERENTIICSGLNLPILLQVLLNRSKSIEELKKELKNEESYGIIIRTNDDLGKEVDEDDLL